MWTPPLLYSQAPALHWPGSPGLYQRHRWSIFILIFGIGPLNGAALSLSLFHVFLPHFVPSCNKCSVWNGTDLPVSSGKEEGAFPRGLPSEADHQGCVVFRFLSRATTHFAAEHHLGLLAGASRRPLGIMAPVPCASQSLKLCVPSHFPV